MTWDKPAASAPTANGALYFKVLPQAGKFTEGTTESFDYIDVQACRVYA